MITWTTYGTWLQGSEKGFVKDGKILPANKSLADSNKQSLSRNPVKLSKDQQQIVTQAILEKAKKIKQQIYAISVSPCHVHIVAGYISEPIGLVVNCYKNTAQYALRGTGLEGRIWTKGFDKRYCYNEQALNNRVRYVKSHNKECNPQ